MAQDNYWSDYRKFHKAKANLYQEKEKTTDAEEFAKKYVSHHNDIATFNELKGRMKGPEAGVGQMRAAQAPVSRQGGGPVRPGQQYTVGEEGPETFVPSQKGMILPYHRGTVTDNGFVPSPPGTMVPQSWQPPQQMLYSRQPSASETADDAQTAAIKLLVDDAIRRVRTKLWR